MSSSDYRFSDLPRTYNTHNRTSYDKGAYAHKLYESTSPLAYQLSPYAYESGKKSFMGYPGFIGSMGGTSGSNPVGPKEIDLESDLRSQNRLNTRAPYGKYIPQCSGTCKQSRLSGYPCNGECQRLNTNNPPEAPSRNSIIPVESVDSRQFKPCNDVSGIHINRFDFLQEDPQAPNRIFSYNSRFRLGQNTDLIERDMADLSGKSPACLRYNLPRVQPCSGGGMGCASAQDWNKGIFAPL